jgi:RNA polymerase sigma factor (sigma-70 family)
VFDRYYRELLNFLTRAVRNRDSASDLTQESFARVYAAERAGMVIRDPRALLYKTARNLLIDAHRRRDALACPVSPGGDTDGLAAEPDDQIGPAALEPEAALAARQRFEAIAAIVDALPPRCREVFMHVKFDGLTHAETAQRMGISVKTVEMQVQIALSACWDRLDALDDHVSPTVHRRRRGRGQ